MEKRIIKMTADELEKYPVEEGVVKLIVLDGVKNVGHYALCPEHGDTLVRTHNTKGLKIIFTDSHLI